MPYPEYIPYQPKKNWLRVFLAVVAILTIAGLLLYQIPYIHRRASWRLDIAYTYARMLLNPAHDLPTPSLPTPAVQVQSEAQMQTAASAPPTLTPEPSPTPQPTATPIYTPTPTLAPTPIPGVVQLTPPAYDELRDKQDVNNCGPATLALYLRFFGWSGNQHDIANVIKPESDDRNVNVEELIYYVRNYAGWLNAEFRVGGDLERLKEILAAGIPVMIEETFTVDRKYWPEDDLWAGHYLLITGYDDANQTFTVHDSELGPNRRMLYEELDKNWQSFNRVYIMVYPAEMESVVQNILGEDLDMDANRQHALETAQRESEEDPQNAFAWFNLGSNLTYFERYDEAASAYDTARTIGLPQRMLRYQFGPFISYFHSMRNDDLLTLTKYALEITRTSEEAMLWRGWAFYRRGDKSTALKYFRDALKIHPDYEDAQLAIQTAQSE